MPIYRKDPLRKPSNFTFDDDEAATPPAPGDDITTDGGVVITTDGGVPITTD
jgi:hypothetical protein